MQKLRKTLDSKHFFYEYKFGRSFFSFDGSLILNPNKEFVKSVSYYSTGALVVKTKLYNGEIFNQKQYEIFQFFNNHGKSLFEVEYGYEKDISVSVCKNGILVKFVTDDKTETVLYDYNGKEIFKYDNVDEEQFSM